MRQASGVSNSVIQNYILLCIYSKLRRRPKLLLYWPFNLVPRSLGVKIPAYNQWEKMIWRFVGNPYNRKQQNMFHNTSKSQGIKLLANGIFPILKIFRLCKQVNKAITFYKSIIFALYTYIYSYI